ncbi:DUF2235 domain-containing protein [Rhodobacteraceae bacterium M382]|nr:DUF2235 domain-containing protein [Rhodobacteraceae bacterium M382]
MAPRKIIICFDGTGNEIGATDSNVLKLYTGVRDDSTQLKHYVPGVGTLEGPRLIDSALVRNLKALAGQAFGRGLENDVLEAYSFLARHYRDGTQTGFPEADQIYVFGFSRGAYASRVLLGFLHNFGLLAPERLHLVTEAFRAYRAVTESKRDADDAVTFARLRAYVRVLRPRPNVPIRAIGLFDTVASMIRFPNPIKTLADIGSVFELATHANVVHNPSVRIVLHALAVDEKRSMFRPLPWKPTDYYPNRFRHAAHKRKQYVEQRWFPGYHSDIGGSTGQNAEIGKLTLSWMLDALKQAEIQADHEDAVCDDVAAPEPSRHLRLNRKFREDHLVHALPKADTDANAPWHNPYALAPIHNSMAAGWLPLEYLILKTRERRHWPRRKCGPLWYLPMQEPRAIPADHTIDDSVYARQRGHPGYRPVNINPPSRGLTT